MVKTYDERLNEDEAEEYQEFDENYKERNRHVSQTRGLSKEARQKSIKDRFGEDDPIEERQKIFEDEIIKRIKEIQKYTKSLHLQIKRI